MRDEALILDIVTAAKDARSFIQDLDWSTFENSRLHQNAVIRSLDVIGEAAGKLSHGFRTSHPALDWHNGLWVSMKSEAVDFAGMGNALLQ